MQSASPIVCETISPVANHTLHDPAPFVGVAGSSLFLKHSDGAVIYKSARKREKEFYEDLKLYPELAKFAPKYYGSVRINTLPVNTMDTTSEFIALEDLTWGMRVPSVIDIKLGRAHHDINPSVPSTRPLSKFIAAPKLGWCISGMKVYKKDTGNYESLERNQCCYLDEKEVGEVLLDFFHDGISLRQDVIDHILKKLHKLRLYFEKQHLFCFRSASLLLIYDSAHPAGDHTNLAKHVRVKLIDFAHCRRRKDGVEYWDYGNAVGVRNIISVLEDSSF